MKRLVLIGAVLALSGCGLMPMRPAPATAPLPHPTDTWRLNGRVAVANGDRGWHASLEWRQGATDYDLRLLGPLGQGGAELQGNAAGVILRQADGTVTRAASPAALVREALGVDLPVAGLRYWVRGLPVPGHPARARRDGAGRLQVLHQDGWTIRYAGYAAAAGRELPTRVDLESGSLRVRLVVDHWEALGNG